VYERQTSPLREYYRSRNMLATIQGEGAIATIRSDIRRAAEAR
jgi:adenylate kinase family enzyme